MIISLVSLEKGGNVLWGLELSTVDFGLECRDRRQDLGLFVRILDFWIG